MAGHPDSDVTKAKFNFLQAVVVAAIAGLVTLGTTLITSGRFSEPPAKEPLTTGGTAATPPPAGSTPAVLDAPEILYQFAETSLAFEPCMNRAREVLAKAGYTGIGSSGDWVFGRLDAYTSGILCYTDAGRILIFGAGRDAARLDREKAAIERLF